MHTVNATRRKLDHQSVLCIISVVTVLKYSIHKIKARERIGSVRCSRTGNVYKRGKASRNAAFTDCHQSKAVIGHLQHIPVR